MNAFLSIAVLLLACYLGTSSGELTKVGQINTYQHGVSGTVYAKDQKTLIIKDFKYDGAGPDAFFWVGSSDQPSTVGTILPYPFEGKFYDYEDQSAPILQGSFDGTKEIELTLPEDTNVSDLKWLSVWCRRFRVNFGDLTFPADLKISEAAHDEDEAADAEAEPETSTEKPELPSPVLTNSVDEEDRSSYGDADAEAEAEAEAESEAESEAEAGGYNSAPKSVGPLSLILLLVTTIVAKIVV